MNRDTKDEHDAPPAGQERAPGGPTANDENGEAGVIAAETVAPFGEATGFDGTEATTPEEVRAPGRGAGRARQSTGRGAFLVGAGILLSRIVGVVRQRVFAYFLGASDAMDAFNAAFRIPNFLQNVFGEGALSASFIPVYAKLLAQDDEESADSSLHRPLFGGLPRARRCDGRALYQNGKFGRSDTVYVWAILAGSAVGLLASTLGRLYASTYYALHDTRTPLRFAIIRVLLTTLLGYLFSLPLPDALGIPRQWGAVGLTASAGLAGWVEFALLRRGLNRRIGWTGLPLSYVWKLWASAVVSAAAAWGLRLLLGPLHPIIMAALVLTPYGLLYFALTSAWGLPESRAVVGRFTRMLKR